MSENTDCDWLILSVLCAYKYVRASAAWQSERLSILKGRKKKQHLGDGDVRNATKTEPPPTPMMRG